MRRPDVTYHSRSTILDRDDEVTTGVKHELSDSDNDYPRFVKKAKTSSIRQAYKECSICAEDYPFSHFSQTVLTEKCGHDSNACSNVSQLMLKLR